MPSRCDKAMYAGVSVLGAGRWVLDSRLRRPVRNLQTWLSAANFTPIPVSSTGQALTFPHQGGRDFQAPIRGRARPGAQRDGQAHQPAGGRAGRGRLGLDRQAQPQLMPSRCDKAMYAGVSVLGAGRWVLDSRLRRPVRNLQTWLSAANFTPIPVSSTGQALTFPHQGGRDFQAPINSAPA